MVKAGRGADAHRVILAILNSVLILGLADPVVKKHAHAAGVIGW